MQPLEQKLYDISNELAIPVVSLEGEKTIQGNVYRVWYDGDLKYEDRSCRIAVEESSYIMTYTAKGRCFEGQKQFLARLELDLARRLADKLSKQTPQSCAAGSVLGGVIVHENADLSDITPFILEHIVQP